MVEKRTLCGGLIVVFGVVVAVCSVALLLLFPATVKSTVKETVPLKLNADGSYGETARNWMYPPYDVAMQFYFFNVSNAEAVVGGGKPNLIQHGPYGYRENQQKRNVSFSKDGDSAVYLNFKRYNFDKSLSCDTCEETDLFTVPNVPLISVAEFLENLENETAYQEMLSLALEFLGQHPFTTQQVGDLIFHGYSNRLLEFASNPVVKRILKALNISLSFPDKMGFFYKKNNSNDGEYQIGTGLENVADVGRIIRWRKEASLPADWWSSEQARMINGTDGTMYAPFLTKSDKPQLFVSDICRSLYLEHLEDVVHREIPGYRFVVPAAVFNVSLPENLGFCVNTSVSRHHFYPSQSNDSDCLASGLLDVSNCQQDNRNRVAFS